MIFHCLLFVNNSLQNGGHCTLVDHAVKQVQHFDRSDLDKLISPD